MNAMTIVKLNGRKKVGVEDALMEAGFASDKGDAVSILTSSRGVKMNGRKLNPGEEVGLGSLWVGFREPIKIVQ